MAVIVQRWDDLSDPALVARWERLSAVAPRAGVFSTHAWCATWAATLGREVAPAVFTVTHDGETIGLLPTGVRRIWSMSWLEFLGGRRASGDHLDLLCAPGHETTCLAALGEHLACGTSFDGLELGDLAEDSPLRKRLRDWAAARAWTCMERDTRVLPYIALPDTYDEYLARLPKKMRYNARHCRDEIETRKSCRLRLARTPGDASAVLDAFFELHARRWHAAGRTGNFVDPRKRDFLRRFAARAAAAGLARFYQLDLHGRPHAVLLAFHWRGTASYYQSGWDPLTPLAGPGVGLIAASIAQAVAEGLHTYDFLRGDEGYKRRWTPTAKHQSTLIVARSARARAALCCQAAAARARAAVRRAAVHAGRLCHPGVEA